MTSYFEGKNLPIAQKSRAQLEQEYRELVGINKELQRGYDRWRALVGAIKETLDEDSAD